MIAAMNDQTDDYSFPDHGYQGLRMSKFQLVRSPRFVKQLSGVKAPFRQQVKREDDLSPRRILSNQDPLLVTIPGAYPSPHSSSTTASSDHLQNTLSSQYPAVVMSSSPPPLNEQVLIQPKNLIVDQGQDCQHPSPYPRQFEPAMLQNHLMAISCLTSPPWTRSSSPFSTPNSVSPQMFSQTSKSSSPCPPKNHTLSSLLLSEPQMRLNYENLEPPSYPPPPPPPPPPQLSRREKPKLIKEERVQLPKKIPVTPCNLISTTSRPATVRQRSSSTSRPFCANPDSDEEPFTLIPFPNVNPEEFPEQSWAYQNVRKLVSRLSANVKARRQKSIGLSRRAVSTSCLYRPADEDEEMNDTEVKPSPVKLELAKVSETVRKNFGQSLSSVLQVSNPWPKRYEASKVGRKQVTQSPKPTAVKSTVTFSMSPIKQVYTEQSPLEKYGLTGKHIPIPLEHLDLETRQCDDLAFFEDDNFDETQVPRSALSPDCGIADPVADDLFKRSLTRGVRF